MSIEEIFKKVDKNNDGKISWDEFSDTIRAFSPSMTSEELDKMFRELDKDGDGQIDIIEFGSCFMFEENENKEEEKEAAMKNAFDLYDIDCDGKISAIELNVVMKRLGEKYTMKDCVAMVKAVDEDGDGFVNFQEFKTMMTSNNHKKLT